VNSNAVSTPIPDKPRRSYRSTLRAEQAQQTRSRIVTAAAELFVERGYGRTTLQAIADAAGVSVVSVQLTGPKGALLLAALEQVAAGSEGFESVTDIPEIADLVQQITSTEDLIHMTAQYAAASNRRATGLWLALDRAADDDSSVAQTYQQMIDRMRTDYQQTFVSRLAALGGGRTDRTRAELADICWAILLPDLYHRLVNQAGWTVDRYTEWLQQTLRELLLDTR
jgi:AcrR family transcriptional regulator